jgi:hypothetical protein
MKTNDLRIGNWVQYDGIPYQIESLTKVDAVVHSIDIFDFRNRSLGNAEPIERTEDVLVKLGFEGEMYEFCLLADDANITVNLIENRIDISYFGNCEAELLIKYNVKYLHQLQNAYYLLTNEELEVKL